MVRKKCGLEGVECFVLCCSTIRGTKQYLFLRFSSILTGYIGLFYGGYGAIMILSLGIAEAFGGYTPQYYNSLGFFVLCKSSYQDLDMNCG